MHDSFDGLRSMIGRKVIVDADFCAVIALVEHCKNPDQLGRGFADEERNQAECHNELCVIISDVEIRALLRDDAASEIDSNFNFPIPLRVA